MTTITMGFLFNEVVNDHSYTLVKTFFDLLTLDPIISHDYNLS